MNIKLRDILLFLLGAISYSYQNFFVESPSATLVGASLALMIGAPTVYRFLDRFGKNGDEK